MSILEGDVTSQVWKWQGCSFVLHLLLFHIEEIQFISLLVTWYQLLDIVPHTVKLHPMTVQVRLVLQFLFFIFEPSSMHGLHCSSLGQCFGYPSEGNTDPATTQEPNISTESKENHGFPAAAPVTSQPGALPDSLQEQQHEQLHKTLSHISTCSTTASTNSNSICYVQDADDGHCFVSPPPSLSASRSSEDDELESECSLQLELKYSQIPRPSIVIRLPKVWSLTSVIGIVHAVHRFVDKVHICALPIYLNDFVLEYILLLYPMHLFHST